MTIKELKAQDWARAARFYSQSPDGEWDGEAELACSLMPEILALVEASKLNVCSRSLRNEDCNCNSPYGPGVLCAAVRAFNAKLETL
jgi:hypothetical protein